MDKLDTLFVHRPSDFLNRAEVTTPFYEKRTINTQETIRDYRMYKKLSLQNGINWKSYTWDVIKPDYSKIVQAMKYLPQINILDTQTGEVVGYRWRNSPDFSVLESDVDPNSMNIYYINVHADNNNIYATYWGKEPWSGQFPYVNSIHVFDWNGNLLYELITDKSFFHIWVDQIRNRLYTIDMNTDEVSYIDLDDLN